MAHTFDVNTVPATGAVAIYKLLASCLAQGWTKDKDSDGTTYSAVGIQILSGNSGTNGLGNNQAWFVMTYPGGAGRSFCFQRGTTNREWRVKYSSASGFFGGAPSATQTPSAADEQILLGSGTDASPSFTSQFGSDGTYHFNCCAGDTGVGYGWYWHSFPIGNPGTTNTGGMMLDVLASGSYPASDTDPAVIYVVGSISNTGAYGADFINSHKVRGYLALNFAFLAPMTYRGANNQFNFPPNTSYQGCGLNPFTLKDDALPIGYARSSQQTAPFGYKGFGRMAQFASVGREPYTTVSTMGVNSRDKIYVLGVLLPWNGSILVTN